MFDLSNLRPAVAGGEDYFIVLSLKKESSTGWTFVKNSYGEKGLVPSTYVALVT